ncbi:chitinase-like protein cluster protein (macronuclear) [Tetrahymena thermophila SB210]|uniref:Chitinase-like protein cluster protein n=1 Tax=Tetrahymena thermophila (strain SB210) TaxID=312017 RepID=I7LVG7_TETTS|nr:chitinase-like protein cluster protein [Tetrahymena thermophila SB210]EAR98196.1 chitinase-like protein cluster protein [Tetrahymena thermophila SB210]|eukprot:XP_001018441.1 chitinase-like protein cluster protein [Tetrahymena thermophila SB210]
MDQQTIHKNKRSIAYINSVNKWWGADIIYDSFGLNSNYDIIILSFWLSQQGAFDAVKLYETIYQNLGTEQFGCSNSEVQKNILDLFHQKQKKLFIAAFGGTDFPTSQNPLDVANKLSDWIKSNPYIDGVDIDYEDNEAILNGTGVQWLIAFQQQIRFRLGNKYIITHAPQAPYFSKQYYQGGGYYNLHKQVGNSIDWYNIQFYNQGDSNTYDSFEKLFVCSGPPFLETSYREIIQINQIPIEKLVLGKPATKQDVYNTGYVNPYDLGKIIRYAEINLQFQVPAFFIWQLKSDSQGIFINSFFEGYNNIIKNDSQNSIQQYNTNNQDRSYQQQIYQNLTNPNSNKNIIALQTNQFNNQSNLCKLNNQTVFCDLHTQNKILSKIAYISQMKSWWGPTVIDSFGGNSLYDILIMNVWVSSGQGLDVLHAYQNIYNYLGTNQFGSNNQQVQQYLKQIFSKNSKKLLIRLFGSSEFPTSKNPSTVALSLVQYLNFLPFIDGVCIDYEDEHGIGTGKGATWLIDFTKTLKQNLTNRNLIIIYEAQASYFSRQSYPQGGYWLINSQIGNLIDFYDIQFKIQEMLNDHQCGQLNQLSIYKEIIQDCKIPQNKIIFKSNSQSAGQINPVQLGNQFKKTQKEQQQQIIFGYSVNQYQNDSSCPFLTQFLIGYNQ